MGGYISFYDPLMVTGFIHASNRIVPVIDARIQKTNNLLHHHAVYDALLIGSSRVEQFRKEDFAPLNVFNYAVPSIYPDEYIGYIDFFLKTNKNPSPVVFLGLDFYGSNSINHDHAKNPAYYIGTCSSPLYSPKTLLSKDSFGFARKMATGRKGFFSYDRESLNKMNVPVSPEESAALLQKQLETYTSSFYGEYAYNVAYRKALHDIKARLHGIRVVIFTTPESNELFRVLVEKGLLRDYERWLTDIVTTFGGVYNFMRPGDFAANHANFIDAHHLFPGKATPIVRLVNGRTSNIDGEFNDSFITSENIGQHLARIRLDAERLKGGADK